MALCTLLQRCTAVSCAGSFQVSLGPAIASSTMIAAENCTMHPCGRLWKCSIGECMLIIRAILCKESQVMHAHKDARTAFCWDQPVALCAILSRGFLHLSIIWPAVQVMDARVAFGCTGFGLPHPDGGESVLSLRNNVVRGFLEGGMSRDHGG